MTAAMIAIATVGSDMYLHSTYPRKKKHPISLFQIMESRIANPIPVIIELDADKPAIINDGKLFITCSRLFTPNAIAANKMIACGKRSTKKPQNIT